MDQGYHIENDIIEIEIYPIICADEDDQLKRSGDYQAAVVFHDQPDQTFFYQYNDAQDKIIETES
ncbi:hypothetical protein [Amphibacillus jilinensis]|uniref:hypothetical protein n=1 Tax=Amphibacillus jilinensis TaxID=1216008 RepID=UPI00030318FF|nr:hypothetical protein [Amphibacillus jilinensis]